MSSFVAHAITGIAVLEVARISRPPSFEERRWLVAFPAVAALPDVDTVLAAVGGSRFEFLSLPGGYPIHRGVTHSLVFALACGLFAAMLAMPKAPRRWFSDWPWLALAAATHPLIDSLMGLGAGIPLFWPLSGERFLSSSRFVPVAYFSYSVSGLVSLLWNPAVWALCLHEVVLFLPFLFLARLWRRARGTSESRPPSGSCSSLAVAIAVCGIVSPVLTLASDLQPVDDGMGRTSLSWVGGWLAIVLLALVLERESRPRPGVVPSAGARLRSVAAALSISGLASYLV
jgi:inner membrane protein